MAEPRRVDGRGWRTLLFVPADRPEMLAKAPGRGADAIVVDLEDAIAPGGKSAARSELAVRLRQGALAEADAVCVRINAPGEGGEEDLAALAGCPLDAIVMPKAADADAVAWVREELRAGHEEGARVGLIPQIESVRGILGAEGLLRTPGITGVAFGGEDFCVDLGVGRSEGSLELLAPRALLGLHARAAGLPAFDTVYTAIDDEAGLLGEARIARQLGFTGKLLIHPGQVGPVRRVFTPSVEEVEWAQRVVASQLADAGVQVVDGKMVDAPVIAQAERILARAG